MTTTTVQEIAEEAYDWFELRARLGSEDERFVTLKDDAPEWLRELVHEAHGDFLPDDWRYRCIWDALEFLRDSDDADPGEFADSQVDVYTAQRFIWLGSNLSRASYVDDALAEYGGWTDGEYGRGGGEPLGVVDAIGMGQYAEASEVFGYVLAGLEARAEEIEDADDA